MRYQIIILTIFIPVICGNQVAIAQDVDENTTNNNENKTINMFIGATGQLAIPIRTFKDYANTMGGFRIEAGKRFTLESAFRYGIAFTALFAGSREDNFKGMNLKTQSSIMEIQPLIRVSSPKPSIIKPYFDFSAGLLINVTQSTTEIIDRPTFLEQVLFNQDQEVESTNHKDHASANFSFGIGAGIIFKEVWTLGVRYHHANAINYVDKDKVYVSDGSIRYDTKQVPVDIIAISIGFSVQ